MKLISIIFIITLFFNDASEGYLLNIDRCDIKRIASGCEKSIHVVGIRIDSLKSPRIVINNNSFDFDVTLPGNKSPSFRLLLPEHIITDSFSINNVHTFSATWNEIDDEIQGEIIFEQGIKCRLIIKPDSNNILIKLSFLNFSQTTLKNVQINVCAGINHLPNTTKRGRDWSNNNFIPESVSLDRTLQGNYWYSVATPDRLKAWTTNNDWIVMHAFPDNPVPDSDNLYKTSISQSANSVGCAAMSADKQKLFYMVWNTKYSQFQSPYAGNACMHLLPLVVKELRPQDEISIEGKVGIYTGTWEELGHGLMNYIKNE